MNNEFLKEKYESGDYICVVGSGSWWTIKEIPTFNSPHERYRLIHKQHKDVLIAYLDGKEIEYNWYFMGAMKWVDDKNFIGRYDENGEYRIKKTKSYCEASVILKSDDTENFAYQKPSNEVKNKNDDTSINNGGKTDYYQISNAPFIINDFDDFAEWRNLNGNQFNMGKVMWAFNVGRHDGTNYERELNKIIHYAERELLRLRRGKNELLMV